MSVGVLRNSFKGAASAAPFVPNLLYRVGVHNPIGANVRIIAATYQNLESRVATCLFREDLLHGLNVIRLRLPALRKRTEYIFVPAWHFMQHGAKALAVEPKRLSDEAIKVIADKPFPGNVRQLENLCYWLAVMSPAAEIHAQ